MRAFEYFTATDSKHAVALLAEHAPARVIAGGTATACFPLFRKNSAAIHSAR